MAADNGPQQPTSLLQYVNFALVAGLWLLRLLFDRNKYLEARMERKAEELQKKMEANADAFLAARFQAMSNQFIEIVRRLDDANIANVKRLDRGEAHFDQLRDRIDDLRENCATKEEVKDGFEMLRDMIRDQRPN